MKIQADIEHELVYLSQQSSKLHKKVSRALKNNDLDYHQYNDVYREYLFKIAALEWVLSDIAPVHRI